MHGTKIKTGVDIMAQQVMLLLRHPHLCHTTWSKSSNSASWG